MVRVSRYDHPMSLHARYIAGGLLGFDALAILWWRHGDRIWRTAAAYFLLVLAAGCITYGVRIWSRYRSPRGPF